MIILLRIAALAFAVVFIAVALFLAALVGDEGWSILPWALPFCVVAAGCVFAFRYLKRLQLEQAKPARPGVWGSIAVILLTAGIICGVGALLVPGMIHSPVPQKRTMADIRMAAVAIEAYAIDNNFYPESASLEKLAPLLSPQYVPKLPMEDAWGNPLEYQAWKEEAESPGPDAYAIVSPGKDGKLEQQDFRRYAVRRTNQMESDIVWRSGEFIQWSDKIQQ